MRPKHKLPFHIVFSGGVVYNDKGEFLVLRRSTQESHAPGQLAYPGGKVEKEEIGNMGTLEENCRSEVLEETGVTVAPEMEYLNSHSFQLPGDISVVAVLFLCKYESGELRGQPGESDEVMWMKFEDLPEKEMIPKVYEVFKLAHKKLNL